MRLKSLIAVVFIVFLMSGCAGQKMLYFDGESENWKVKYVINVTADNNSEQGTVTILYTGDGQTPDRISYTIEGASGEISGNMPLENGALETSGSHCSGCATAEKDDQFNVTIAWDGKTDEFVLKHAE